MIETIIGILVTALIAVSGWLFKRAFNGLDAGISEVHRKLETSEGKFDGVVKSIYESLHMQADRINENTKSLMTRDDVETEILEKIEIHQLKCTATPKVGQA